MDDFSLADPNPEPLDLSGLGGTPPFVSPQTPQPKAGPFGGMDKQQLLKLSILMPLAMKAGPGAVQGLLQGFAAHDAQQRQLQQQNTQNQRLQQTADWQQQYQQGQLKNQDAQRRQQGLQQFASALNGVEDPAAVDALVPLYSRILGMPEPDLRGYASKIVTPDTLQQRKIAKRWAGMSADEKALAQRTGASLTIDGQTIPYAVWSGRVGGMVDPKTNAYPQAPAKLDTPNTPEEQQIADRIAIQETTLGRPLTPQERADVRAGAMAEVSGSRRKPDDPVQAALAAALLQQRQQQLTQLPPRKQNAVQAKQRGFEQNQVVKNTQTMAEAVSFANSLNPTTTNPADDQALIYAFAKAMDPNSVVREGEYATVQKYAQSWADSFGFNAARIFSNTAFLTPQARANMKRTIQQKFAAAKGQYDNLRKSYANQINQITGDVNGADYLTDYGGAFPADAAAPQQPVRVVPPSRAGGAGPLAAPGANPFRR